MQLSEINVRTGEIVDSAMKVHSKLGPGLLESVYEACLTYELRKRGYRVVNQLYLPITYETVRLEKAYRIDMLVEDAIVVEIKAVSQLHSTDHAQIMSHMRLGDHRVGLLINFNETRLKDGIHRKMI